MPFNQNPKAQLFDKNERENVTNDNEEEIQK